MKTLIALFLVMFIPVASFGGTTIPIEQEVLVDNSLKNNPDVLSSMVALVKGYGYRCDSISAANPMMLSRGYELVCNNFAYKYELRDKGGKWIVTVK